MTQQELAVRDNVESRGKGAHEAEVPLASLTPDPRNARSHSVRNLAQIEASLREVGAARSIVVDEDGMVLAGNATVQAALGAGFTRVRVVEADGAELVAVRRSGLSPEQKRRLALWDNRAAELADWDADVLASLAEDTDLSGLWEPDELAELLGMEPEEIVPLVDPDAVPDVPEEPVTKSGDLWLLGPHRLLCGDSTEPADVRRLMEGARAVVMPTDPPYLVNYRQQLIWTKSRPVPTHSHYLWQHEPCFYGWVQGKPPGKKPPSTATTVWKVDLGSETMEQLSTAEDAGSGLHPTQKPVELIRRMVEYHTEKGEGVYDPFAGSGTCLVACALSGRVCLALDLAPADCDVVVRRWEALTVQTAARIPAEA